MAVVEGAIERRLGERAGCYGGEESAGVVVEEAEQWRRSVERVVAAGEVGVGEDAAPQLAYPGGADEVRGFARRDAEEDLSDGIVDELRRRARLRHGACRPRRRRASQGFGRWKAREMRRRAKFWGICSTSI